MKLQKFPTIPQLPQPLLDELVEDAKNKQNLENWVKIIERPFLLFIRATAKRMQHFEILRLQIQHDPIPREMEEVHVGHRIKTDDLLYVRFPITVDSFFGNEKSPDCFGYMNLSVKDKALIFIMPIDKHKNEKVFYGKIPKMAAHGTWEEIVTIYLEYIGSLITLIPAAE